jgi:hypothetical protein
MWMKQEILMAIPRGSTITACVLMGLLIGSRDAVGQEALWTVLEADRSYEIRQEPARWADDPLQAGPVQFEVGAGITAEWNDNVNLAETDRQQDYILRPQVNVRALWPITERTRLSLGAGIGYTVYLEGNRRNRLLVAPDSELAFDMTIRDVLVTVYDQVAYSDDLVSEGALGGDRDYARISNTAGIRATWFVENWRIQGGYSHFNFWSLSDDYRYLNRSSEQFFARVGYALGAVTQVGIEATGSITDYSQPVRSDFHSYSSGPFVEWSVTEDVRIGARAGYVRYVFEDRPIGPSMGTLDSYYVGVSAAQRLTAFFSHRLGVSRDVRVGIISEYEELFRADYSVRWALLDPASISAGVYYENSREPRTGGNERYDRLGFSTSFQYELIRQLTASLAYRFTWRDSNLPGRNYRQNRVAVGLGYRF